MSQSNHYARRPILKALGTLIAGSASAPMSHGAAAAEAMPVVRLSRGSFAAPQYEVIRTMLAAAQSSLVPAIRALDGCLHYHAGIDRTSATLVNVSVWRSLEDARQMESLAPMLALAADFTQAGVVFERPIVNYETLWNIE